MTLPFHLYDDLAGHRAGDQVTLTGAEAHHAVAVRRLRPGERLALTDGRGCAAEAEIVETGKRTLTVRLDGLGSQPEPQPAIAVVQALPKGDRGELAVEMLTEVGAAEVLPWAAERCVAVWRGERATKSHQRWQATAREAAKQARRAWHPTVSPLVATDEVLARIAGADLAVVLHEAATQPLTDVEVPQSGEIVVVVGPEGGLSDAEIAALTAAGARSVRLGSEVLRTSTAGVAACAALLSRTPRWS